MEIGIYCYLTADTCILTNVLPKWSLSSPLSDIHVIILCTALNSIGCRGNRKAKFAGGKMKNHLLRSHKGDEADMFQKSECLQKWHFLLMLLLCFRCYGSLKFPLAYNGKSGNWPLLLSHCLYFDKSFTEMFLEKSSAKQYFCPYL